MHAMKVVKISVKRIRILKKAREKNLIIQVNNTLVQ